MDFRTLGLDPRLLSGAPSLRDQAPLYEKMLNLVLGKGENVLARISLSKGRAEAFLLPALQWLCTASGQGADRILCVVPGDAEAATLASTAAALGRGLDLKVCVASLPSREEGPVLEGDPSATLMVGSMDALLEAQGLVDLKRYGFLLVDGLEAMVDGPEDSVRRFRSALLPSSDRKAIMVAGKLNPKIKNLAWDLADNPVELHLEAEAVLAQSVDCETWLLSTEEKTRFLLGLLARRKPARTCVFCNLKASAEELALRLRHNGVEAEYILGSLAAERKLEILKAVEAEAGSVLVLTDEGAQGLGTGRFPLVVNYDLPLEPELYIKRLDLGDRGQDGFLAVNLVCDRYAVGLPAIERSIDASLAARPVSPEVLLAEDKSEGFIYEAPRADQGRGRKAGRLAPPRSSAPAANPQKGGEGSRDRRPGSPRPGPDRTSSPDRKSGADRKSGQDRRGGTDRRPGPDRSPDIRRSIAEAAGGAVELDKLGPPKAESQAKASRPKDGARPKSKGQGGRQAQGKGRGSPGTAKPGDHQRKGQGRSQERSRPQGPATSSGGRNPYDLSMEERMEGYREKYSARPSKSSSKPQGKPQAWPLGKPQSKPQSKPQTGPSTPAPLPASKGGFLSRLFGRGKNKGE